MMNGGGPASPKSAFDISLDGSEDFESLENIFNVQLEDVLLLNDDNDDGDEPEKGALEAGGHDDPFHFSGEFDDRIFAEANAVVAAIDAMAACSLSTASPPSPISSSTSSLSSPSSVALAVTSPADVNGADADATPEQGGSAAQLARNETFRLSRGGSGSGEARRRFGTYKVSRRDLQQAAALTAAGANGTFVRRPALPRPDDQTGSDSEVSAPASAGANGTFIRRPALPRPDDQTGSDCEVSTPVSAGANGTFVRRPALPRPDCEVSAPASAGANGTFVRRPALPRPDDRVPPDCQVGVGEGGPLNATFDCLPSTEDESVEVSREKLNSTFVSVPSSEGTATAGGRQRGRKSTDRHLNRTFESRSSPMSGDGVQVKYNAVAADLNRTFGVDDAPVPPDSSAGVGLTPSVAVAAASRADLLLPVERDCQSGSVSSAESMFLFRATADAQMSALCSVDNMDTLEGGDDVTPDRWIRPDPPVAPDYSRRGPAAVGIGPPLPQSVRSLKSRLVTSTPVRSAGSSAGSSVGLTPISATPAGIEDSVFASGSSLVSSRSHPAADVPSRPSFTSTPECVEPVQLLPSPRPPQLLPSPRPPQLLPSPRPPQLLPSPRPPQLLPSPRLRPPSSALPVSRLRAPGSVGGGPSASRLPAPASGLSRLRQPAVRAPSIAAAAPSRLAQPRLSRLRAPASVAATRPGPTQTNSAAVRSRLSSGHAARSGADTSSASRLPAGTASQLRRPAGFQRSAMGGSMSNLVQPRPVSAVDRAAQPRHRSQDRARGRMSYRGGGSQV